MALPPISSDDALRRAARLIARGQVEDARHLYEAILRSIPGHKKARKALKALDERIGAAPLTEENFRRIDQLMRQDRLREALAELNRLCKHHEGQPALQNLRGVVLSRLQRAEDALDAFQKALMLKPDFTEALNNLASALSELQRFPEAIACYQKLVKQDQADADIYANLARALRGNGQLEDAATALNHAIRLRPLNPDAFHSLGNICSEMGRNDVAVRAYENALSIKANHRGSLLGLGKCLYRLERFDRAEETLQRLLRIDGGNAAALAAMADTERARGRGDAAVGYYRQLLDVQPDDAVARHMLQALGAEATTRVVDPAYSRALFEAGAADYEKQLDKTLKRTLQEAVPRLLERIDGENAWYPRTLDLGCGTGLAGPQIRPYCETLTGVDVSSAMLARAAEKAVYDDLVERDILTYLQRDASDVDLAICVDALPYIGAVDTLFAAFVRQCTGRGRFIVTTEVAEEGELELRESGRYAHGDDYVRQAAENAGLSLLAEESIALHRAAGESVAGRIFMFTIAGNA